MVEMKLQILSRTEIKRFSIGTEEGNKIYQQIRRDIRAPIDFEEY